MKIRTLALSHAAGLLLAGALVALPANAQQAAISRLKAEQKA